MPGTERDDWIEDPTDLPTEWEIGGPALETADGDDDQLIQRIVEWAAVLRRVGGIVSCAAIRREIAPDHYVTVGFKFKWDSFAPTERLPREARQRKPRHERLSEDDAVQAEAARLDEPLTEDEEDDLYTGESDPGDQDRDPADVLAGSA